MKRATLALALGLLCAIPSRGMEGAPEPQLQAQDAEAADPVEPVEPDLSELPLSDSARVRLERARGSVVQIRSFFGNAATEAAHGSGFAVDAGGFIITNYHVVSAAVLYPGQYRLEYLADDERRGQLQVLAIDVGNDLALVKPTGPDLQLPALRLREEVPRQGERAYSIGFPLDLGLTITEGVANGLVAGGREPRIHYTGAINSGMSGGPALDSHGAVYGVNVSLFTNRQLVGFVVPARHILPLLETARRPQKEPPSPRQLRAQVAAQVLAYQAEALAPPVGGTVTQRVHGYTLPTRLAASLECATTGTTSAADGLSMEFVGCNTPSRLVIQSGLDVGQIQVQHRIVSSARLHPLQLNYRLNRMAAGFRPAGSPRDVAEFACQDALVSLDGFDARVTTCVRQYRLFETLYDFEVVLLGVNRQEQTLLSHVSLRGTGFESGQALLRRFLEGLRWSR